jgi:dTDP-4-dehydrorhamnose 3,5-epimerase
MKIIATAIEDLKIIEPSVFVDPRGFFMETYRQNNYQDGCMNCIFVQDNLSFSQKATLRGLHFQLHHPQAKLVQAITGEIFDVAVDIRRDSPTFGKWSGVYLSEKNKRQLFIPAGFAHGFCVVSDTAHVYYKCSDYYQPRDEGGILWSDPAIAIDWPVKEPILSEKDNVFPLLSELPPGKLDFPSKKNARETI